MTPDLEKLRRFAPASVLVAAFFCALVALSLYEIPTFDTWFHLAFGRVVAQQGTVPTEEIFTYPNLGHAIVNPSWLYGLGLYGLHQLGGVNGIQVGRVLLAVLLFVVLIKDSARGGSRIPVILAILFLVALAARDRLWDRPELPSYILLALFIHLLNDFVSHGRRGVYALVPLQVLWANLHGSALMGVMTVGIFWGVGGVQLVLSRRYGWRLRGTPCPGGGSPWGSSWCWCRLPPWPTPTPTRCCSCRSSWRRSSWSGIRCWRCIPRACSPVWGIYGFVLFLLVASFVMDWRRINLTHLVLAGAFVGRRWAPGGSSP